MMRGTVGFAVLKVSEPVTTQQNWWNGSVSMQPRRNRVEMPPLVQFMQGLATSGVSSTTVYSLQSTVYRLSSLTLCTNLEAEEGLLRRRASASKHHHYHRPSSSIIHQSSIIIIMSASGRRFLGLVWSLREMDEARNLTDEDDGNFWSAPQFCTAYSLWNCNLFLSSLPNRCYN